MYFKQGTRRGSGGAQASPLAIEQSTTRDAESEKVKYAYIAHTFSIALKMLPKEKKKAWNTSLVFAVCLCLCGEAPNFWASPQSGAFIASPFARRGTWVDLERDRSRFNWPSH